MISQVSLVKSKNSYSGVQKSLKLIGSSLEKTLAKIDQLVVKINFVSVYKELATTPSQAVKGFTDFIQKFYNGKIIIAEEATIGSSKGGFKRFGFQKLANNPKIELLDSAKSPTEKVTIKYPDGEIVLPLAEIYTQSPFVVSICRAKTHNEVVTTLAIKNLLVGAIQQKLFGNRGKVHQGKNIHWILAKIAKHTFPDLAIIDGTIGMQGNGPDNGVAINSEWVVSSLDSLAADSLASYLMGFEINDIGYLNLIRKEKLGLLYPKDKIEVIGENPEQLVAPYQPHSTFAYQRQWQR